MWGKIKRHCPVGDTIAWPTARAAKGSPLFKDSYRSNLQTVSYHFGAVTLIQTSQELVAILEEQLFIVESYNNRGFIRSST